MPLKTHPASSIRNRQNYRFWTTRLLW